MRWLQRLLNRNRLEEQLDEELRFHIDRHVAELIAGGVPPTEARRRARLAIGGPEQVKESCRDARGTLWLENLWHDFRYGLRTLGQRRIFTSAAVLTLALGIGASTAIFSAVNRILIESLPYPDSRRIVAIWDARADGKRNFGTFAAFRGIQDRNQTLEAIAVTRPWQPTLTGNGEAERLEGQSVSADYLRVLGVAPVLGRDFTSDDDRLNGPRVAILSTSVWRQRFAGDPAVIGRQILLDNASYTVIGVMPPTFENVVAREAEVWRPLQYDPAIRPNSREWGHHLRTLARLRPGQTLARTGEDLEGIRRALSQTYSSGLPPRFQVLRLQDDLTSAIKPSLIAVLGAVLLVLAIACVNVTNLMLARGSQRKGEFAMRAALGAGRMRLIRQVLAENLLVALLGGAVGIASALAGVRILSVVAPRVLLLGGAVQVDSTALVFAIGATGIAGLLFGFVPAWHISGGDLLASIHQRSRSAIGSHQRTRRVLVVAEVAMALVLLVSAGLLLRSLQRLFAIDPGFDSSHLLTMQVQLSGRRFNQPELTNQFFTQVAEAVRHVPGVKAAGLTSQLPLSGDVDEYGVQLEPVPGRTTKGGYSSYRYAIMPGYLETLGITLRRGRLLDARDTASAPPSALVSESLARSAFGGQDPVGQRIRVGPASFTVVGVVGDVKQTSLAASQAEAVYVPSEQWLAFADHTMSLVVRAHGDAAKLAAPVKRAVSSVDANQPIVRVATMDSLLAQTASERRFALILFEAFAVAALMLAAIGVYGVLAGNVAERTREIGIRAALGATRADILAVVIRQGVTLAGIGAAIGVGGAAAVSRLLGGLLFGISPLDPITFAVVIALLVTVTAVASWIPAWRAVRVDPSITLRAE
jgi:putative ABC transport system permease protein